MRDAEFSPDGTRIVTASADKTAVIWDAQSGRSLETLRGHIDQVNTAVFSPDGKHIATASNDHTARLWDSETGFLLFSLPGHADYVDQATYLSRRQVCDYFELGPHRAHMECRNRAIDFKFDGT